MNIFMQGQVMFSMVIITIHQRCPRSVAFFGSLFIPVLLSALLMVACTKETDDRNPVVEILLPFENQAFTVGDSIRVQGNASDETALKSIQVTVTDLNFIVKDYVANVSVSANPQHFDFWYTPVNLKLPDGDYYIQVRASDGVNTKYKYRQIRLSGIAPELSELAVITRNGDASFTLHSLSAPTFALQERVTYQNTYAGSDFSWYAGQLYLLGRGFGECYVLNPEDYTLDFKLFQDGTPSLYYHEKLLAGSDRFYIGLTEGYIKGYNKIGNQQFIAELTAGRKPGVMAMHRQQFLVVAEEHRSDPGSWIAAYFLTSGDKWTEYRLPEGFQVVSIASVSQNEILIAGNVQGVGKLLVWNIAASAISTVWDAGLLPIRDLLPLENGSFLLACQSDIKIFQLLQQSAATFLPHSGALKLRMDVAVGTLYVGNTGSVTAYNLQSGVALWQTTFAGTLADFHLNYE